MGAPKVDRLPRETRGEEARWSRPALHKQPLSLHLLHEVTSTPDFPPGWGATDDL